jgi:hypothetical protein
MSRYSTNTKNKRRRRRRRRRRGRRRRRRRREEERNNIGKFQNRIILSRIFQIFPDIFEAISYVKRIYQEHAHNTRNYTYINIKELKVTLRKTRNISLVNYSLQTTFMDGHKYSAKSKCSYEFNH